MNRRLLLVVVSVVVLSLLPFYVRNLVISHGRPGSATNTSDKTVPRELVKPVLVPDAHPGSCADWQGIADMLIKERTRVLVTNTAIGRMKLAWVELRFVARQPDGTEADAVPLRVSFAGRRSTDESWGGDEGREPWVHLIPYQLGNFGVGHVGAPRIRCPAFDGTLADPLLAVLAQTPDLPPAHDRELIGLRIGLAENRGAFVFGTWYQLSWTLDPQWHRQGVSYIRIPDQIPPGQVAVFHISLDESMPDPFAAHP